MAREICWLHLFKCLLDGFPYIMESEPSETAVVTSNIKVKLEFYTRPEMVRIQVRIVPFSTLNPCLNSVSPSLTLSFNYSRKKKIRWTVLDS